MTRVTFINSEKFNTNNWNIYFSDMPVRLQIVQSKDQLKQFIFLPQKIHDTDPRWVPPIYMDEWKFYNPKYNKALTYCDTVLFLAFKDSKPVGRIMGIINTPYNQLNKEKSARFFNFECYNDQEVSHALIGAIEDWASNKGMQKIVGPFGFSDKDPEGVQIEGFDHLPVLATATNYPYLKDLIESKGYAKKVDCFVYKLDVPKEIPALYRKVYDRIIQKKEIHLKEFTSRKQLKPYIIPVFRLVNETYKSIYGFVPMEEEEMKRMAAQYLPILDPEFTKIVTDDLDNPLAFVVATPDISRGVQKAGGKLFPFGFIHILSAAKKSKQLDLFLGAVINPDQNRGLTALLGVAIFRSAQKRGMSYIDSHLILESNKEMRAVMEKLGAKIYKRYRVFEKNL